MAASSSSSSPMQAYVETSDWLKVSTEEFGSEKMGSLVLSVHRTRRRRRMRRRRYLVSFVGASIMHSCSAGAPGGGASAPAAARAGSQVPSLRFHTPSFVTTTTTASPSRGTSARPAAAIGPKAAPSQRSCRWGCRKNKRSSSASAASKIIKPSSSEQGLGSVSSLTPLLTSYNHEADTDLHLFFPPGQQLPPSRPSSPTPPEPKLYGIQVQPRFGTWLCLDRV
ncbi:hypothetical protein HPP92_003426 [Vanilla planifolia]|uniref:Uncharacterized protein n=1 Tax=Vanilla planifolia TaxID=51239 RepID=A0A835S831_VANPL|nr:hypothetical protein HPP92_003426 [Vanilla planifolia]